MKQSGSVLLRKFIHDRLYYPGLGYFCKPNLQVGELKEPIDFPKLFGYSDYIQQLTAKYPQNAWLTPSEIFKPYYGMTIGNYINQAYLKRKEQGKAKQLRIVEAGAGSGAAAHGILQYFKNFEPALYYSLRYTIVQISPDLCANLQTKFKKTHPELLEKRKIQIINQDIVNYSQQNHSFVLFFQVLDNMAHDRVVFDPKLKQYTQQTMVNLQTNEQTLQPIQDSLIKQCLQAYKKVEPLQKQQKSFFKKTIQSFIKPQPQPLFLPTYFLMVLKKIKQKMPEFDLVISDFDSLPSTIPGINAPIVSHKGVASDEKKDFSTYLVNRGDADIFFPTNFNLVNELFKSVTGREGQTVKSDQFVNEFSISNWAETRSGYNPLKEDFANTSFFVSKI